MKSLLYHILPTLFILTSTTACYININDDDFGPSIKGSGHIIVEERALSQFDHISLEGAIDLIIRQGENQKLEIQADDNIVSTISTSVRSRELKIRSTQTYRSHENVVIFITLNDLEGLEIRGSGDVYGETIFEGDYLDLEVSGSGNLDLEIYYDKLSSEINGSGNFKLEGTTIEQEVSIYGSGDYRAQNLLTSKTEVSISGSGNSVVSVSDYLRAEIRGSGDIIFYGNPEVSSTIRGSGNLIKR